MSVVIRRLFLGTSYISNASHCSSERKLLLSALEVSLMINTGDSWGIPGIPTYAHTHTGGICLCCRGRLGVKVAQQKSRNEWGADREGGRVKE